MSTSDPTPAPALTSSSSSSSNTTPSSGQPTNNSTTTITTTITSGTITDPTTTIVSPVSSTANNTILPNTIVTSSATTDSSPNTSGVGASANTATTSNGSLSDSVATSRSEGQRTPSSNHELLSKTNLYIKGLDTGTSDQDLFNMCSRFGQIVSSKAILEKMTGFCKGYGFVEFHSPQAAELAVQELTKSGIQAQMAKISPQYTHNSNGANTHRHHNHHQNNLHHHHNQHHLNSQQNLHNGNTNSSSQHHNHNQQHSHNQHHHHHHHNYHLMNQHGGGGGGGGAAGGRSNANSGANHNHQNYHHQASNHNHHGGSNSGVGSGVNAGTPGANSASSANTSSNSLQHSQSSPSSNNADPTNLYIANLPTDMGEQELEELLSAYGPVVSTRILRDTNNVPRGVGFARMETRDKCEQIIEQLNAKTCKGCLEPLVVKFADGGNRKRQHHNNHHQHNTGQHQNQHQQHHNNSGHHQHHHKVHQTQDENSRWRDNIGNTSDLDLAIMSPMGYPRIPAGFAPPVAAGSPYPPHLALQAGGPQWIHPAGPGQPYVMPQQMLQAGGLGPSNQVAAAAAAAAALHYGHIPQLTSQMQSLQIATHPGAPVGGYLPAQHQWSAIWPHPIPAPPTSQAPMRPATPMRGPAQSQNP